MSTVIGKVLSVLLLLRGHLFSVQIVVSLQEVDA